MTEGFLTGIDADAYHGDSYADGPPALSASILHTLLTRSPKHAWANHPKLNPEYERKSDDKYAIGTVAHQVILEGRANLVVVDAPDWRTKDARELKANALERGALALLADQWDEVRGMCEAVHERIETLGFDPQPFDLLGGVSEQTILWHEPNGTLCKGRPDWISQDHKVIWDLKTSKNAEHEKFSRSLFDYGYDTQAEFYRRGVERITGIRPDYFVLAVEPYPPFELSVHSLSPAAETLAQAKIDRALELWAECLRTGVWPGYDTRVAFAEPPAWHEAAWLAREARESNDEQREAA